MGEGENGNMEHYVQVEKHARGKENCFSLDPLLVPSMLPQVVFHFHIFLQFWNQCSSGHVHTFLQRAFKIHESGLGILGRDIWLCCNL